MIVLAVTSFPHVCLILRGPHGLHDQLSMETSGQCEVALPYLFSQLLERYDLGLVDIFATFDEPGPFSAIRMTKAFMMGITRSLKGPGLKNADSKGATLFTASLFSLFPEEDALAIHAGGRQWLLRVSGAGMEIHEDANTEAKMIIQIEIQPGQEPPIRLISSQHTPVEDTFCMLERLILAAQNPPTLENGNPT